MVGLQMALSWSRLKILVPPRLHNRSDVRIEYQIGESRYKKREFCV